MAKKSNKKNGLSKKQKKILKKTYKKFVKQHQNRQSYVEYPEANCSFNGIPHNLWRILHAVFAEKCKSVEDTVNKLELHDSGVNLIEYISSMTGKLLVINLRARDILNSEFGIKLATDGIHGVTVNASAPNCFNANATMNALKPDIKGCSAQLTALKPLHNILNNLTDFIDFRHPFVGSIESGNETYDIVGYSLNELVNTMIFSIMSLSSDDIQFLNNAIAQDDYCRDCINENLVLTKAVYTANVTPHPIHLPCYDEKPVITEITAEFSFPDDETDFTIQCTDCEFGDCCHESDGCSCCEHADEDSYDLVAPGEVYDDGEDDDCDNDCIRCMHLYACDKKLPEHEESDEVAPDEEDDKLLTKVDDENIVNNLKNGDLVVFGEYDANDNCKVQVGRVLENILNGIQISVAADKHIHYVVANADILKKSIATVLSPETTVITPSTIICMKDIAYYTTFINDDTAEDGTIWKNVICNFINGGHKLLSRYAIMNDILEYASAKTGVPITEACVLNTDVPAEFIDGKISVNIIDIQKTDINE